MATSADGLTRRQRSVLKFVHNFHVQHGYSPSLMEIGKHLGIKRSTVFGHVKLLIAKGRLQRTAKTLRTLVVVEQRTVGEIPRR